MVLILLSVGCGIFPDSGQKDTALGENLLARSIADNLGMMLEDGRGELQPHSVLVLQGMQNAGGEAEQAREGTSKEAPEEQAFYKKLYDRQLLEMKLQAPASGGEVLQHA